MSVSDLKKLGLLRPESEWTGRCVGRSAYPLRTFTLALFAIGSCAAMAFGTGLAWIWIGLLVFVTSLVLFVMLNIHAVGVIKDSKAASKGSTK
jgi:hypothetical protein